MISPKNVLPSELMNDRKQNSTDFAIDLSIISGRDSKQNNKPSDNNTPIEAW